MNVGVALAVLAVIQLLLTWGIDSSVEKIDRPLFVKQVDSYNARGVKDFFTNKDSGEVRVDEVLRLTRSGYQARSTITALAVSIVVLGATIIIVAFAEPRFEAARLTAGSIAALLAVAALVTLLVQAMAAKLAPAIVTDKKHRKLSDRVKSLVGGLRTMEVLTGYRAVAFIANIVAAVAALGA